MAWNSTEEKAMYIVCQHMGVMKKDTKRELCNLYTQLIFPMQGHGGINVKWTTVWGVTFIKMWDEEHPLQNIQYEMIMEMMKMGPMKYYIVNNVMPNFSSKVLLLLNLRYRLTYF